MILLECHESPAVHLRHVHGLYKILRKKLKEYDELLNFTCSENKCGQNLMLDVYLIKT
jgi:hypothetical protein